MIIFRKGGTIKRVVRRGGENKNSGKGGWLKKNVQQRGSEEKIPQSELHCRAYKLYSTEWQPLQYCSFNFLVVVESPLT